MYMNPSLIGGYTCMLFFLVWISKLAVLYIEEDTKSLLAFYYCICDCSLHCHIFNPSWYVVSHHFISEFLISLFQGDVACRNFTLTRPLYILAVAINTKYTLSSAPSSKIVSLTLAPAPITTLLPTDTLGPSWKRIVTARIKLTGLHLTSVSSLFWPKI